MKISVVIPTYNRSAHVEEALASVLAQHSPDTEIIVVDDGSTDDTFSVLSALKGMFRYVRQAHAGVSAARNHGIRLARGEWIAFLDSDDKWYPGKLKAQQDYFSRHPEMKICQTEEVWIRNGRRLNPKKYHRKPSGHCFPLLLERCLISPSAVMIHRELFEEVGLFDESLPACEDYDLWLRIGYRYPVGLIEEPLIEKRGGHSDQLSASIPALDRYRIQALAKLLRKENLSRSQQELTLKVLTRKCRIYAQGCQKRGNLVEAERILRLPHELTAELGL